MRLVAVAACLSLALIGNDASGAGAAKKQLWGAIAYNGKTGAYGYAVDRRTKRDAEAEAFRQCGADCNEVRTFRNGCGAVAAREGRFAWGFGATRQIAELRARDKCAGEACRPVVWACTSEK
jgi:uncharacterized protein DUF4189